MVGSLAAEGIGGDLLPAIAGDCLQAFFQGMERGEVPFSFREVVGNKGAEVRRIRHTHFGKLLPYQAGGLGKQVGGPCTHYGGVEIEAE